MPFPFIIGPIFLLFCLGQVYWVRRAWGWLRHRVAGRGARMALGAGALALYLLLLAYNFRWFGRSATPVRMNLKVAVLETPFLWWVFSSTVAFLLVALLWIAGRAALASVWAWRKLRPDPPAVASPPRRAFLERSAALVTAAPFVAGAYGLFYGRLNLQTTRPRIRLPRLPRAFEAFRIAQLSDIHVGPYMSEEQIRRYAQIVNELRPDLIVLTGDFVTWDAGTQEAVVRALAGLRAPFGVFGCLGNHEAWSGTEDSITRLFAAAGIRILRQAGVPLVVRGESIHLIGIDYASRRRWPVPRIETLIAPGAVNILLSHNPDTFDRAAALGIDLSLAGHTHGGQVALEFISPEIAPSRIMTPYVSGWFERPGGQLYVNRGIGTIGAPMRIGAPPEIAVFELVRGTPQAV